jgi:hypothetical protein
VLFKLDAETFVRGTMEARAKTFDDLSGKHLQVADLLQIARLKKVRNLGHRD